LARLTRFELVTLGFVDRYSIQLSYRRIFLCSARLGVCGVRILAKPTADSYAFPQFLCVFW
jgi:hypothetical protein